MKDNLYFNHVPNIDSLFMEQVLFSFENIPIVFVCVGEEQSRYLCVCDDIIDEESWLIVKIDNKDLLAILNDNATVLSAFTDKEVIIANRKLNQNITYDIVEYNTINKDDLPVSDQYLEMKNSLKAYIEKIEHDISCSGLKLPFSGFDTFDEDLDDSNMAISIEEKVDTDLSNGLFVNADTDDNVKNFSGSAIKIEYDYTGVVSEPSTFTEEIVLIAYAA